MFVVIVTLTVRKKNRELGLKVVKDYLSEKRYALSPLHRSDSLHASISLTPRRRHLQCTTLSVTDPTTNERTNKRKNEQTNEYTNERTNERKNKLTKEQTNERTNEQTNERTNKRTNK